MNLNPVDILIAILWIYFIFRGFKTGFILQLAQIISIIVGYTCANIFHGQVYERITPYIDNPGRTMLKHASSHVSTAALFAI